MNYKKIFVNFSILSLGTVFTVPAIVSATALEIRMSEVGDSELSNASQSERKGIEKIKKDPRLKIMKFVKLEKGSILVVADKKDYEEAQKERGNNHQKYPIGEPVEISSDKNNICVIKVKCRVSESIPADKDSVVKTAEVPKNEESKSQVCLTPADDSSAVKTAEVQENEDIKNQVYLIPCK